MHKFFAKTQFLGKKVLFLPQCHSTNDIAMSLVNNGHASEGMVVMTDRQTAGKGQRGNSWETEPEKNLTYSVILKPDFVSALSAFDLHLVVSLAISDFLKRELGDEVKVKWPNDIYFGEKKLCGILIENTVRGANIDYSVIGIGLNVNQQQFELPKATSMRISANREFSLDVVAEEIILGVEKRYEELKSGEDLWSDYLSRLFRIGENCRYQDGKGVFNGRIVGVNKSGQLEIATDSGLRSFNFKEVSFLD